MIKIIKFFFLIFLFNSSSWAVDQNSFWYSKTKDNKVTLNVELFISSECPYCKKADAFFKELEPKTPWIHVTRFYINEDKSALIRFSELLNDQHMDDFAVPSIFFCNSRWVGFSDEESTGKELLDALNYCKSQIEKSGSLSTMTENVLKKRSNSTLILDGMIKQPTTFYYMTIVSILDAYNPCAFFAIAGFFAFIVFQNQRKKQLITGLIYIISTGIMHYLQQTHSVAFIQMMPWFRVPAGLVGMLGFYFIYRKLMNQEIPFFLSLVMVFLSVIMIQLYQQTCLMNWSYIFEQWFEHQAFSSIQAAFIQSCYQLMYLLPLFIVLILYLYLQRSDRFIRYTNRFSSIGLLFLLIIYALLIVYPTALSNLVLSLIVLVMTAILGLFVKQLPGR